MKELIEMAEVCKTITKRIGIDTGNSFTNVVGEQNYYDVFSSCLVENFGNKREDGENTIEIDNRHFTIGQGELTAESASRRDMTKYEALIYYAICRNLEHCKIDTNKQTVEIHLGIGLPCGNYSDNKAKYSETFKNKVVNCRHKGKEVKFMISLVRVVPQGSIVAHNHKELFKNIPIGYIIDFGSFTIDVQRIINGELSKTERKSYEIGTIKILQDIGDVMNRLGGSFVDLKDMERALIDGEFVTEDGMVSIEHPEIQEILNEKINAIVDRIKRQHSEIRSSRLTYIIGGGAIVFRDRLEKAFVNSRIEDNPERLNAQEYYYFIGGR